MNNKKFTAPMNLWELFSTPYLAKEILTNDFKLDEKKQGELNNIIIQNLSKNEEGKNIMRTIAEKYIDEGISIGEAKGVEKTAINMLKQNTEPKFVASVTGLSIDDILRLKNRI